MNEHIDECLRGAGCAHDLCEDAARLDATGCASELLPRLAEHRLLLLADLRKADDRLDCLDRAIRQIRAKESETGRFAPMEPRAGHTQKESSE